MNVGTSIQDLTGPVLAEAPTTMGLPFAHLNLRFNPFGELDLHLRADVAVVDLADWPKRLAAGRFAIQFLADCGRGKTTHLLALRRHFPDAAAAGDWSWYIGAPEARGDGIDLGQSVGASLAGHNRGLLLVTPGFSQDLEIFLPGWLVLVGRDGRRFADETTPYSMMAGLFKQRGHVAFAIFDENARAAAAPNPLNRAYWVDEILQAKAEEGRIVRADSLATLATQAGIDAAALSGTLERYNAYCENGSDSAFLKNPISGMRKVDTPPFYAVEVRPNVIAWTGAGLRIDAGSRVIGCDERPIPGLYAAGETVGSLHGDRYIGGGGSFGPCLVFGKIAGERAAALSLAAR
jgi:fumarate reductase flavoprotein subunit